MRIATKYCFKTNNLIIIILLLICLRVGYSQPVTWYRTWGNFNRYESGTRVVQTFDGGYVVLVETGNQIVAWNSLLKYNSNGNLLWAKTIIDSSSERFLVDMKQTNDSGFIISGWSSGALLVKMDKYGNLKWYRNYTNLNPITEFTGVIQTRDRGYIACGSFTDYINPSEKGIVIKTDSLGYVQWERYYMDSSFNVYGDIYQDKNGKYYLAGVTSSGYPDVDHAIIKKLDSLGNIIWNCGIYNNGAAWDIVQLNDGSLIIGGIFGGFNKPILAKIDTSGNLKWAKSYSSPLMWYYFMCKDAFDNIIITGNHELLGTITNWKLDTSGTILKTKNLSFLSYNSIYSHCIKSTNDTGFIITGSTFFIDSLNNEQGDALIVKTDSAFNTPIITTIKYKGFKISDEFKVYQNYPNPFNASTFVKFFLPKNEIVFFIIYDILGKKVFSNKEFRNKGLNVKYFDFEQLNLSSGVYFIKFEPSNLGSKIIKVVFLK